MTTLVKKTTRARLAGFVAAAIAVLALPACANPTTSAVSPSVAEPSPSNSLLPRTAVVPLPDIQSLFPDLTQEADMGWNPTASGDPLATRSVAFTNNDGSKKVTVSTDAYADADAAAAGYQKAVQLSRDVPGFTSVPVPSMGEQVFAGSVTQGAGTHVGIGVLDGKLVLGATTAGYDATPENIAKLVALMQAEIALAKSR
ncbi:hypothetical protein [Catellatospora tritici]|uniref:hypothetical protein n=1 Tax=Catellatospora tritici TaxID=2851566 RepID=UPI001C2D96BB|nr:hypothetical protein [Catellatospora tritici]MBV1856535.1 hypothetical protein [Catellatospora tritici]